MIYCLGCSLIYGTINVIFKKKQKRLLQYASLNEVQEDPTSYQLFLEELYEKYLKAIQIKGGSYLEVMGLLNLHQEQCQNIDCPCISGVLENNQEDIDNENIDTEFLSEEEQIRERIQIKEHIQTKGVYLYSQTINQQRFKTWINSFIDFHIIRIIKYLETTKRTQILEQISIKYWYFQMKFTNNPIKACSSSKITLSGIQDPSLYFCIVERGLTKQIKNRIMQKDKAASYSYKLKIADEAKHISELENIVHSETQIEECKSILIMVLKMKLMWLENLINGYNNIDLFFKDTLNLMRSINFIEKEIETNLNKNKKSIQYKKLYSLIKARLVNDPILSEKLEQEIQTQKRNDSVLDSTIISSLSILSGKVGSIVASFRNNELDGKILSFSQRFPEIMGYEYQEFKEFKNLRVIMPKVVADIHEIFMSRLINTGKPVVIRKYRNAFSIDKKGYLFLIKLFSNYHFQLMDQFAFSALILKLEPKIMLLLVDKFGHICGINQIFQEKLGCMGIDPLYFNQLHQALFFPQILDFYQKYDVEGPQEDLNFLKQMMNFPKPFEITNYIEEFLIHYKEFQKKEFKSDAHKFKSLQKFFSHFYNNICIDHNLINIGDPKLETTMQLLPEKIPTGTGGLVELFVVIVHQWKEIDEQKTSSLGMSMGATDLDGNTQSNHYQQQYRGNTYVSSLNMSRQFDKLQTDLANNNNINNNSNIVRGLIQNSEEMQKPGQCEELDQKLVFDNILDKYEEDNKLKIQKEQSYRITQQKNTLSVDQQSFNQNQTTQDLSQNLSKENTYQNSQNNKLIDKRSRFYCVVEESDKSTEKQDLNQIGPQDQEIETEENDLSLKMRKTNDSNDVQFGDEFQAEKGNAQASVSSSIQSVEVGALKQIKMFTKDKSYPREIIFLYLTFCVQIIIFFSVIVIFVIFLQQYFDHLQDSVAQLILPLTLQAPISIIISITQFYNLKNSSHDNTINLDYYDNYNMETFLYKQAQESYERFSSIFDTLLNTKITFNFQQKILNYIIKEVHFQDYQTQEITTHPLEITEVSRAYTESLYSVTQNKSILTDLDINNYDTYFIVNNYNNFMNALWTLSEEIGTDIDEYQNKISSMNLYLFIISLILILFSFIFIIPAFNNLKLRIERICQVVSRITEKEAYYEIYMINSIQGYLLDHQELYLHCVFTNYDINKWDKSGQLLKIKNQQKKQESVKNKSQKSRNSQRSEKKLYKPKRGKNESGILTDRINESKLNYNAIYIIVAILFFLSIGFFITVFIYVSQFKNNFQPFIDSFSGFIQASNKYGIATSSEMLTYVYYLYKNTDEEKYLYNEEIFKSIIEDQDTIINSSQQYFSQDFYQVSLDGGFNDEFQDFLYYINNEDICENSQVIQEYEKQLCEQADSDILSKGIQLAIKQVFNKISKNDIENWTQEQIINYIHKNTFEDDFILYVMVQKIFLGISDQYSIANKDMKETFLYILHLMFLIGGIIYGLLFLILVAYFISNLQKDYILIKSAIQVVPYHRLAEDHTTHHLLKRIFKF